MNLCEKWGTYPKTIKLFVDKTIKKYYNKYNGVWRLLGLILQKENNGSERK